MRRSRKCPVCGQTGIPIVYGYPSPAVFQAADEGLLAIGGCVVLDDEPTWWCKEDEVGWDGPDQSRAIREVMRAVEPLGSHGPQS